MESLMLYAMPARTAFGPNNEPCAVTTQLAPQDPPDKEMVEPVTTDALNVPVTGEPLRVQFMLTLPGAVEAPKFKTIVALLSVPITLFEGSVTGVAPISV